MTDLNGILEKVYDILLKKLYFFDSRYVESLRIFQTFENYKKSGKASLAINSVFIFALILEEENRVIDDDILTDLMLLLSCLFYSYGLYDAIHDHKKTEVLSCANVLFKEAILLATRYGLDISVSVDIMEQYNRNPVKIRIGRIDMQYAADLDRCWYNVKQGFHIAVAIVEQFVKLFIPSAGRNWTLFYQNYLIYSQIMDDFTDFTDDYRDGVLKSFGIFALVMRFEDKLHIDLNNSINSLKFELFVLKNTEMLHRNFFARFHEYILPYDPDGIFDEIVRKLKNMNSVWKKEAIL